MFKENRNHFTTLAVIIVVFVAFLASGCATTKPMALTEKTKTLDITQESIALMTLKTMNQYVPSYQPYVGTIFVVTRGKGSREKYSFKVDKPYNQVKKQFNEYIVSISNFRLEKCIHGAAEKS